MVITFYFDSWENTNNSIIEKYHWECSDFIVEPKGSDLHLIRKNIFLAFEKAKSMLEKAEEKSTSVIEIDMDEFSDNDIYLLDSLWEKIMSNSIW